MKRLTLVSILSLFVLMANAQQDTAKTDTSYWKTSGLFSLNFSQVQLINWAAGGQNNLALNGLVDVTTRYKKGKKLWESRLNVAYGVIRQGDEDLRKSDDKLEFNTKFGYNSPAKNWNYTGMLNFRTQMAPGFNFPNDSVKISDAFAPAYLQYNIGMEYSKDEVFTALISPLAGKTTFVMNQTLANQGAFGVEAAERDTAGNIITEGQNIRYEFGGFVKLSVNKEIWTNVKLQSNLELFSNYLENPQNIDVNWETLINLKVNKFLSANLTTHLIYDDDITIEKDTNDDGQIDERGPRTQFKEVFSLGLSYKF